MSDALFQVLPVYLRERIPEEAIQDVVSQISVGFRPQRIVLFGSYAYGDPRPESDVDLLVIMDTPVKETQQAICILQAISYHFGLDPVGLHSPAPRPASRLG